MDQACSKHPHRLAYDYGWDTSNNSSLNSTTSTAKPCNSHQPHSPRRVTTRQHATHPVEDVAPFGLAILTELAEFAAVNHSCWIMDY